ncbi:MAG: hypothetical protein NZ874_07205 [Fimbriimonadales bacterium]|nr:hypothetical protein [Fimbriimonadales bacterium]
MLKSMDLKCSGSSAALKSPRDAQAWHQDTGGGVAQLRSAHETRRQKIRWTDGLEAISTLVAIVWRAMEPLPSGIQAVSGDGVGVRCTRRCICGSLLRCPVTQGWRAVQTFESGKRTVALYEWVESDATRVAE